MPKPVRTARPPRRGAPTEPRTPSWLRSFFATACALSLFGLLTYLGYADYTVRKYFDGKRWALPARVYAAPLELYPGAPIGAERLQRWLDDIKYRLDRSLATQGTYSRQGSEFILRTRDFQYSDKAEPSRRLRIVLLDGETRMLQDLERNRAVDILRLEPPQIGTFYPRLKEDRVLIKLSDTPALVLDALFAVEDREFRKHHGVSLKGILRALWANVKAGGIVQGGSTLTQQLVKNFYLTSERTWWRKVNEIAMALLMEARYDKDQILEAYLNEIYLGQDGARAIHGFGLASQYYFARSLDELQLPHIALLVGLVRGPSFYDPLKFPDKARQRRDLVLDLMAEVGTITEAQAREAKEKPLDVLRDPHQSISRHPAFLDLVRRQLQGEYRDEDLTSEGLRIFSTLDVNAQALLESAVKSTMPRLDKQTRGLPLETAAVITRRGSGEVVALLGSRDPQAAGFNRALDAVRPIGSLIKPAVYLTALSEPQKFQITSLIPDTAIRLKGEKGRSWTPQNYDHREHGIVPLHTALAQSFNLATVRLGLRLGLPKILKTLRDLGVSRSCEPVASTLLGACELSVLEVAQMYQTLAGESFVTPLRSIHAVLDPNGNALRRFGLSVKQTVSPAGVYLVNTVLQEVMLRGTGRPAYATLPEDLHLAGKTGTSNDLRDSWFAGFSGDYLGVAWIGRDDNQTTRLTGAQGALQIWVQTMRHLAREPLLINPPDNIELVWVDPQTGLRSSEECPSARRYPFVVGTAPSQVGQCSAEGAGQSFFEGWFD